MLWNKYRNILYILGSLIIVLGITMTVPLVVSLVSGEGMNVYSAYYIPIVISLLVGFVLTRFKTDTINLDLSAGMILCTFGWLISSFIGSIPFQLALDKGFIDALFEAVSGFTTTGITVFQNLEQIPFSIILWRSLIQWLGGLGILTFFLLVTFRSGGGIWSLFTAESHKINSSRPVPNIFKSIQILWGIYLIFTIAQIIIMVLLQVGFADAVIHSLTTISTGGFSNYDSSIGYYQLSGHPNFRLIEYVTIFFMLMGGINFLVHYNVFKGRIKELFSNIEMKYFWRIILIFVLIIIVGHYLEGRYFNFASLEEVFRKTLFQVTSIMTTTGYGTESIGSSFFPAAARQLFLVLMLIGGCVGSTAGGTKVMRVSVLSNLFIREIKKINSPKRAVMPVVVDNRIISHEEIYKMVAIFFAWILLILVGGAITAIFSDLSGGQAISGMFSAVGNVGPFYFSVEKMSQLSPVIKITYILGMLAGRLEILPLFILFRKASWK
ncbi:MAG: TrkH family potassium uptake protein, partial [Halanaerobiaceae bacterium]